MKPYHRLFLINLFLFFAIQVAYSQEVIRIHSGFALINLDESSGLKVGDELTVKRRVQGGEEIIGAVRIFRFQDDLCAARIISEQEGLKITPGDFIQSPQPTKDEEPSPIKKEALESLFEPENPRFKVQTVSLPYLILDTGSNADLIVGQTYPIRRQLGAGYIELGRVEVLRYRGSQCACKIVESVNEEIRAGDWLETQEISDAPALTATIPSKDANNAQETPTPVPAKFLQKLEETVGINLIYQSMSPDSGKTDLFTGFNLPLAFSFTPSRYVTIRVRLNQGYQSFSGMGLYALSDLDIRGRFLMGKHTTLLGGLIIPTGKKELEADEITASSAGRIPFINAPMITGHTGFGLQVGVAHGLELSENTRLALGASYRYHTAFKPIKFGEKYNPANELVVAAGLDMGDNARGFTSDVRFSMYSAEKLAGEKFTDSSTGLSCTFNGYWGDLRVQALLQKRQASPLVYGGDFKPPMIFNVKAGAKNLFGPEALIPFVGFEHTGEGTLMEAANLALLGVYFENMKIAGYPWSPFLQLSFGKAGEAIRTFGVKVGTNVSFQIY